MYRIFAPEASIGDSMVPLGHGVERVAAGFGGEVGRRSRTCSRHRSRCPTPIEPPIASMRLLLRDRPRPVPSTSVFSAPSRSNGENMVDSSSWRIPRPGVRDTDPQSTLGHGAGDVDVTVRAVVLDRVGEQVDQHLLDALLVGEHPVIPVTCETGRHVDPALGGERSNEVERFFDHGFDPQRLQRHRQVTGLDTRQVEDLVDQAEEVSTATQDLVHALELVFARIVHFEELTEADDGVQRGAQLVAHPRQELALGGVRSFCFALGRPQVVQRRHVVGDVVEDAQQEAGGRRRAARSGSSSSGTDERRRASRSRRAVCPRRDPSPGSCGPRPSAPDPGQRGGGRRRPCRSVRVPALRRRTRRRG